MINVFVMVFIYVSTYYIIEILLSVAIIPCAILSLYNALNALFCAAKSLCNWVVLPPQTDIQYER